MNKKIARLAIPVVALVAIAALVAFNYHRVERTDNSSIPEHDFHDYLREQSEQMIANAMPFKAAQSAYNRLYAETTAEASIMLAPRQFSLLDSSTAWRCYSELLEDYFPHFTLEANRIFNNNWGEKELGRICDEAKDLMNRKGLSYWQKDTLQRYAAIHEGYRNAMAIKKRAANCTDRQTYSSLKESATHYMVYPYTNCTSIGTNFASMVETTAKKHWGENIKQNIERFCEKYNRKPLPNNTDKKSVQSEYDVIYQRISDYYNSTNEIIDRNTLDDCKKNADKYLDSIDSVHSRINPRINQ